MADLSAASALARCGRPEHDAVRHRWANQRKTNRPANDLQNVYLSGGPDRGEQSMILIGRDAGLYYYDRACEKASRIWAVPIA